MISVLRYVAAMNTPPLDCTTRTDLRAVLDAVPVPYNYPLPVVAGPRISYPRASVRPVTLKKIDTRTVNKGTVIERTWEFYYTDGTKYTTKDPDVAQTMILALVPHKQGENR